MNKLHARGFSIVEVLVAITISLILLLGLLQIFISNKNSYRLETNSDVMHDNARFIYDYLTKLVRQTGYRSPQKNTQFTAIDSIFDVTNLHITGTNNTGTNNSDTLVIRYQGSGDGAGNPDGTIRDCLNIPIDSFVTATMTFSITANDELQCRSQNPSSATPDSTQILLENVENFQVLYGEDTTGDKAANRYVDSTHPNLNMANVVAVRISVLLRSQEAVNPTVNTTSYKLNDAIHVAPGDNFLRQPLTFTIMLRNVIPEITT